MTPPKQSSIKQAESAPQEAQLDFLADQVVHLAREARPRKKKLANDLVFAGATHILERSGRVFLMSDVIALITAFLCGGFTAWGLNVFHLTGSFQPLLSSYTLQEFVLFLGLGGIALLWLDSKGHYRQRLPYWETVGHFLSVALLGLVIGGFVQFALKNAFSRLWLGASWTYFALFLFTGRELMRRLLMLRGEWEIPALLVGNGPTADAAREVLENEKTMGFKILAEVAADDLAKLSRTRAWRHLLLSSGAGYIFLALEGSQIEKHQTTLKSLARDRLPYSVVPPWLGLPSSTLSPHHFVMRDVMLLHETNRLRLPVPRLMKRAFDLVVASLALLVLSPLMITVGFLIRRDGGPVFYSQPRVGQYGRIFPCLKFRSMKVDADQALQKHLEENPEAASEWQQFQKLKNDPRITKFGDFIRRTSIDELPQLFNVIRGEMSLVGPRPIMQGQESYYEDDFVCYEMVRPGITGPWQVSGRNQLTFKQRVALETWYSRNWSLWLDIVIMLKTIPALLKRNTAF
jgi:Undecaprenyl-phosphate galactose phosphotransferase WbaP